MNARNGAVVSGSSGGAPCSVTTNSQALRDIERRLRWESPELIRLFDSVEPQQAKNHRKRARTRVLMAAAALTGLALLGPRMLNEAEIRTQKRPPLPRTSPPDTTIAERADPVSGPAAAGRPGRGRGHIPRPVNHCRDALPPWPMCGRRTRPPSRSGTRARPVAPSRGVDVSTK